MILRQQAALDYPSFPVLFQLFRVHLEALPRLAPKLDTRNLCSMPGNVFADPSAPDETKASSLRNVYAKKKKKTPLHMASPCFETQGDPWRALMKRIKTLKASQFLSRDVPETYLLGILPLSRKRRIHKITWLDSRGIKSPTCISINSLCSLPCQDGGRASKQKFFWLLFGCNALDLISRRC